VLFINQIKTICAASVLAICYANSSYASDVNANLTACPATKTAIGEVGSCGKIWKIKSGHAKLGSDGTLSVEVKGLVLNDESTGEFNGTPDGVDAIAAAVICDGKVAAQTEPVLLSKSGDAKISAKVSVPDNCAKPVIVVRERYEGKIKGWLATSGM
jgi:hypothetical protein